MTTRDEWLELSARCEKATGPDREIDAAIASGSGGLRIVNEGHPFGFVAYDANGVQAIFPRYTNSLDAITALIERDLPDVTGIIPLTGSDEAWLWPKNGNPKGWRCNAATPALALCAAFCRAMAEKTTP